MTDLTEAMTSEIQVRLIHEDMADSHVIHAARVSTLGDEVMQELERLGLISPEQWRDRELEKRDVGLINFLMRERHGSPFEHNSATLMVRAPIFVFREFHRHRVGWSYNEESGRYKKLDPLFYVPPAERPLVQVGKAGAYTFEPGTSEQHEVVQRELSESYARAWQAYESMLEAGVAREVARLSLPLGIFSSMYTTCNARSLMHFLGLRTADERATFKSGPQWEIDKLVARKIEDEWARLMPITHEAFNKHGRMAP